MSEIRSENSETIAAQAVALAVGEAHHHERIVPQAPVWAHANITRTGEGRFQAIRVQTCCARRWAQLGGWSDLPLQPLSGHAGSHLCGTGKILEKRFAADGPIAQPNGSPPQPGHSPQQPCAAYKATSNKDDLAGP